MNGNPRLRFFGTNLKMNQTADDTAQFVADLGLIAVR
jgi:hypothetical protein